MKSEDRIRKQILREFLTINDEFTSPTKTDAVVVLGAEEVEIKGENKDRILTGIQLVNNLKSTDTMVFLGTKTHNLYLKNYLQNKKLNLKVVFPLKYPQASTRTQIKCLYKFLNKTDFSSTIIVSHAYHIPRIKRYCLKYISKSTQIDYYPVGDIKKQMDKVEIEVQKIIKYSEKGDLPLYI